MVAWINKVGERQKVVVNAAFSLISIFITQVILDLVIPRRSHAD